ncbi:MAG: DUF4492 domain-containing protein [Prevotella sp.]
MRRDSLIGRIAYLYIDGFRNMKLGKVLWSIILIKLAVVFLILKIFFFPNFLSTHADKGQEPDFVAKEIIERSGGHTDQ